MNILQLFVVGSAIGLMAFGAGSLLAVLFWFARAVFFPKRNRYVR